MERLKQKLNEFHASHDGAFELPEKYIGYADYIKEIISGEGMVGDSYLMIWEKNEIGELNDAYESQEFLSNKILIGSNGGGTAYGINKEGYYIEVPFIGMCDEEAVVIAENFEDFIDYVWSIR